MLQEEGKSKEGNKEIKTTLIDDEKKVEKMDKEVKSERHLKNQRKRMSYYCPQKQRGRESYLQEERERKGGGEMERQLKEPNFSVCFNSASSFESDIS